MKNTGRFTLGQGYLGVNKVWDSLLEPIQGTLVASFEDEKFKIDLTTEGFITILDVEGNKYVNEDFARGMLQKEILTGEINNPEKFTLEENNWFEVTLINKDDRRVVESYVFETDIKNLQELKDKMELFFMDITSIESVTA